MTKRLEHLPVTTAPSTCHRNTTNPRLANRAVPDSPSPRGSRPAIARTIIGKSRSTGARQPLRARRIDLRSRSPTTPPPRSKTRAARRLHPRRRPRRAGPRLRFNRVSLLPHMAHTFAAATTVTAAVELKRSLALHDDHSRVNASRRVEHVTPDRISSTYAAELQLNLIPSL